MSSPQILLVDHQEKYVDFCRTWLQREGYEVHVAPSHDAARYLIGTQVFDLALVELTLPEGNSLKVLKYLNADGLKIPIIIHSGAETLNTQTLAQAVRYGAVSFLRKPCPPNLLLENVRKALPDHSPDIVRGNLRNLSLPSLIAINCNEGRKAKLIIRHHHNRAVVYFEKGNLTHAHLNNVEGAEAVYEALTWTKGRFVMMTKFKSPPRTIHANWSGLIMEGLRRLDEGYFDQEQLPEEEIETTDWSLDHTEPAPPKSKKTVTVDLDRETQRKVESRLTQLHRALYPRCIVFTTHSGRLLHFTGALNQSHALSLSALIAGSFSATDEIAELVAKEDEEKTFQQNLQEGVDISLYSAQVAAAWILSVAFDPDATPLGMVRQFTRHCADDLTQIISEMQAPDSQRNEVAESLDAAFREQVSDALGDLFS